MELNFVSLNQFKDDSKLKRLSARQMSVLKKQEQLTNKFAPGFLDIEVYKKQTGIEVIQDITKYWVWMYETVKEDLHEQQR